MHRRTAEWLALAADTADEERRRSILNEVAVLNISVANSIARRFRDRGCATEDLEQVACVALVKAVRDFDPCRGHHFLSYAVPCITGAVKKHFRDAGWMIRPPRSVQELQSRVDAVQHASARTTGRNPSDEEIADELEVDARAVSEATRARGCFTPTSLDLPVAGGTRVLADLLVADDDGLVAAVEARMVLSPALSRLDQADRAVLRMRFVHGRTQHEIASLLGLSQPAVSRLLGRILHDLSRTLVGVPRSPAPAA